MKNSIQISLPESKISALRMYLSQKNTTLECELSRYAEQLYGKTVPQNVREFIEMTAKSLRQISPNARRRLRPNQTEPFWQLCAAV